MVVTSADLKLGLVATGILTRLLILRGRLRGQFHNALSKSNSERSQNHMTRTTKWMRERVFLIDVTNHI